MKRLLIHIIARYYLWKFRRQETNPRAKYRLDFPKTGSVYIQRRTKNHRYKDVFRVSNHVATNSRGNPVTKMSKKYGIVI